MSQVFKRHDFTTALIADNVQVMKKEYHFERGFDYVKHVRGQQHDDWLPKESPQIDLPCLIEKIDASPKRLARYRRNAHWYQQQDTNATETVFREAMSWLKKAPKKFLLWIDSFDPHETVGCAKAVLGEISMEQRRRARDLAAFGQSEPVVYGGRPCKHAQPLSGGGNPDGLLDWRITGTDSRSEIARKYHCDFLLGPWALLWRA